MRTLQKPILESSEAPLMSSQADSLASLFPMPVNGGGQQDQRYLWPEMLRVINEVRPTWVIGENVAGIGTMVEQCRITDLGSEVTLFEKGGGLHRYTAEYTFTIERICSDLESKGYSVQPMLIPACAVGAPHRRDRIFFIAHYTDSRNDLRESGQHESESGKERLSERNEVRQPGEPSDVRSEMQPSFTDTECLRLQHNMVGRGETRMSEAQSRGRERSISEQVQFVEAAGKGESITDSISGGSESFSQSQGSEGQRSRELSQQVKWREQAEFNNGLLGFSRIASDTDCNRGGEIHQYLQSEFSDGEKSIGNGGIRDAFYTRSGADGLRPGDRWKAFPTVSAVHRGNDGIPFDVDKLAIPFGKWRTESIKAYGNAIVPQVMYRIFEAIEALEKNK
jgi:DNA (cytosine-5)-methyltransferase 1